MPRQKLQCTDPPKDCTVVQLKALLRAAKLRLSGNKSELQRRYNNYLQTLKPKSSKPPARAGAGASVRSAKTPKSTKSDNAPVSGSPSSTVSSTSHPIDPKTGMKLVESDLSLRVEAMRKVDYAIVKQVGPEKHTATIAELDKIAEVKQKLGKGAYGVVFSCCVENQSTKDCVSLMLPSGETWTVDVALKVVLSRSYKRELEVYSSSKQFNGNNNVYREALLGRLLNRLVMSKITPHSGLLYVPLEINYVPKIDDIESVLLRHTGRTSGYNHGVVTFLEMSEMDAATFIKEKAIFELPSSQVASYIRVMVLQVLQGLIAARTHLGFSHNDLHTDNAMMNTVEEEPILYKMRIDGVYKEFAVPNKGLQWKIIDTGFATSEFLHEGETASIWRDGGSYLAGHGAKLNEKILSMSPDLYDIMRFVTSLEFNVKFVVYRLYHKNKSEYDRFNQNFIKILNELDLIIDTAIEISEGHELMGSLVEKNKEDGDYKTKKSAINPTRKASDILLRRLFELLARDFEVRQRDSKTDMFGNYSVVTQLDTRLTIKPSDIYDTDKPLKATSLSGFESRYLSIQDDNSLRFSP